MSERASSILARLRLWGCNLLIGLLLSLLVIDSLPTTPEPVRARIDPLVDRLGIWQGPWHLFSPNPDSQNHRFRAEITYDDGRELEWQSPAWRDLSPRQRFRTHRQSEFLDHVWGIANEPAWEPWARHLAATARPSNNAGERPREVRMIIEVGQIEPSPALPWPPRQATDYNDSWVLFTKKYP